MLNLFKSKASKVLGVCLGTLLLLTTVTPVLADRLESENYIIQFGNFNIGSGEQSGSSVNLTTTIGQTAAGPFGVYGDTNFIGSGFQYIYQQITFSFAISSTNVDLGVLSPGTLSTASNQIFVNSKGTGGYTVTAHEKTPLSHTIGAAIIPDTTCDQGDCDETIASNWTNQDIPGFGFNIAGDDVPADFTNSNYFRQFADLSSGETSQVIMSASGIATNRSATITYQAGITPDQEPGDYQTGVVYLAVPGF